MLRNEANLAGEVMVFGYLKYLEVWNAENFRRSRLEEQPYTDEDAGAGAARYLRFLVQETPKGDRAA